MKDLTKLIVAGGFLSVLFLYGGLGDHSSNVDRLDGETTISNVQQDSLEAGRMIAGSTATGPVISLATADETETPNAAAKRTARTSVSSKPVTIVRFVVYFDFDSDRISSRSKQTIRQALEFAKSVEAKDVGLAGYADSAGPADYNMKLSERRANVVAAALQHFDAGVKHMDVKAFGEQRLAVNTPDGLAHQRNRRVEIIVSA